MIKAMKKLKNYVSEESGSEPINQVMMIGGFIVLTIAVIGFATWRVNNGATEGADKAKEAGEQGNIQWSN